MKLRHNYKTVVIDKYNKVFNFIQMLSMTIKIMSQFHLSIHYNRLLASYTDLMTTLMQSGSRFMTLIVSVNSEQSICLVMMSIKMTTMFLVMIRCTL